MLLQKTKLYKVYQEKPTKLAKISCKFRYFYFMLNKSVLDIQSSMHIFKKSTCSQDRFIEEVGL